MPWFLDAFKNRQLNTGDKAGRLGIQTANVAQESVDRTLGVTEQGAFHVGRVVRAGAGTYDVVLRASGTGQIACVIANELSCYYLGVNDCVIPVEGSRVLAYVPFRGANFGVIVCVLPAADLGPPINKSKKIAELHMHQLDLEPSASAGTEKAYRLPHENQNDTTGVNSHVGRPNDLMPGNRAWVNEQGVGVAILNLMAALKASDRAKIEVSLIDDIVRIVSGYYRHIHAQGEDQVYNDGGYVTRQMNATSYQCEKSAWNDYGSKITEDSGGTEFIEESVESRYALIEEDLASKKRFQIYIGHLGDLAHLFVAKPDPGKNPERYSDDSRDQGLLETHMDSSGRLDVRSAGGLSLQRWDRIPIPKMKRQPWDPEGDKMEGDGVEPSEKKSFEFAEEYPYGHNLEMRDAMAWRNRQAYLRLHDQSQSTGHKDYYLPEEQEMQTPDEEYDKLGKAEEKFQEYDLKQAYLNIEPDGSIIMRDSWGSEILLRGGNIILSCPGQIEVRSGKSIVQLAGHDIIAKARKSMDLTARDKDVRIKANTNLHMVSEGRKGADAFGGGGILLESKSSDESALYEGVQGEGVISKGIVLKAEDSRVFLHGKTVHTTASRNIFIEGKDPNGGPAKANLYIAVRQFISNADNSTSITTGQSAGVFVQRHTAFLTGQNAYLIGGRGVAVIRDSKAWVPLQEADINSAPYTTLKTRIEDIYEMFQEKDEWLEPFDPAVRNDIKFTYRSSEEYGTLSATEVYQATEFYVYEAAWSYLLRAKYQFIQAESEKWIEYDIEDTFPWPGKEQYDGEPYVRLIDENNVIPDTSVAKKRDKLTNKSGGLEKVSFHEYEVTKS